MKKLKMTMITLTIFAVVSACFTAGSAEEAQRSAPILKSELLGYWKIDVMDGYYVLMVGC
jgi:hypothetical protein